MVINRTLRVKQSEPDQALKMIEYLRNELKRLLGKQDTLYDVVLVFEKLRIFNAQERIDEAMECLQQTKDMIVKREGELSPTFSDYYLRKIEFYVGLTITEKQAMLNPNLDPDELIDAKRKYN